MKTVVIDASFSAAWFLKDGHSHQTGKVLELFLKGALGFWIPSLWFYEITNLLIQAHTRSRIQNSNLEEALDLMGHLHLKMDEPDAVMSRRVCRFAQPFNLSAYDAAYFELADRLQNTAFNFR